MLLSLMEIIYEKIINSDKLLHLELNTADSEGTSKRFYEEENYQIQYTRQIGYERDNLP